jgi:nucleoside-diphosphate-sugar epimerase
MSGTVLRYGWFYGPGTSYDPAGTIPAAIRKGTMPIVGAGAGTYSFINLQDAAAATLKVLAHEANGIYNIVDDDPAPVREWLPLLADALGAKPPRHVPAWLARRIAGEAVVMMGTDGRGASNAKAKRELGWTLRYPSWRQGFAEVYAKPIASTATQIPTPA